MHHAKPLDLYKFMGLSRLRGRRGRSGGDLSRVALRMYGGKIRAWFGGANGNKGGSVGARSRFRKSLTEESRVLSDSSNGYGSVLVAAVLAALVVVWAAANLLSGGEGFAVPVSDKVMGGEEAASALARLIAALVLGLFLADSVGWRARWVAVGLVVLGLGHLVFGYLEPLIQEDPPELNESLYEAFVTQTLACALFMVGLFPGRAPRPLVWAATVIPAALVVGYAVLFEFLHAEEWMPPLSRVADPERTMELGSSLGWLTSCTGYSQRCRSGLLRRP